MNKNARLCHFALQRTIINALLACFTALWSSTITAQNDAVFKMTKENGHFYFDADVNGAKAKLMLESGIPGFMIGESFYEAHKEELKLDVKESTERIRFLSGMRQVKLTAQARLCIGDAVFEGPIKIIKGNEDLKIPIQMLFHASDGSNIVKIDLKNSEFSVVSSANLQNYTKDATSLDLSFNKWNMPIVNTRLTMDIDGRTVGIKGNFIADMGNASLLFLNKSQSSVIKMLNEERLRLQEARDTKGRVVAEGLYAKKLTICGRTYHEVSVGVNPFNSLNECGFLGLKFFTMPTIFDFGNNKLYLCK